MNITSPQLVKFTNEHRSKIVEAAVLFDGTQSTATVGTQLRVEELLDILIRAMATGDVDVFVRYLQSTAARIEQDSPVRTSFSAVWPAFDALFVSQNVSANPHLREIVAFFANQTQDLMGRNFLPRYGDAHETFDEIDATIEALVARLDVTSPFTAEHSRAVSAWCARLARRMSLSDAECATARRGGLIHDIGKASTPADILDAPRALTPDEWIIMRNHTTSGAAMLETQHLLTQLIPAVRSHHERLDGKGYPDALSAPQIPLIVRIITVADCFNAMVGRRPYRPPMPPTRALEELSKHRGTQFDPDVVDAMVEIVGG